MLKTEGDLQVFMAYLRYFKEALAKLRPQETEQETVRGTAEGDAA